MKNPVRRRKAFDTAVRAGLAMTLMLVVGSSSEAKDKKWTIDFEPVQVQVYGHDQHVLTIHDIDLDPLLPAETRMAIDLDTEDDFGYRGEVRYNRGQWGFGLDVFWFVTSQNVPGRTSAAEGPSGVIDQVVFEVADQTFTSTGPGEVLFYNVLEDTDLEAWTLDLYAIKTLAEKSGSGIHLMLGLRNGDFDNDYRAVLGLQGGVGSRLDSSSNYDRMMGPIVGLTGDIRRGKHYLKAYVGQSVLIGSAELSSMSRGFTGPVATPTFFDQELFLKKQDVAIPVTEVRIKWMYRISKRISAGAGTMTSVWWDVTVPPGVIPGPDGDTVLHENTIVFFGLAGAVEVTF